VPAALIRVYGALAGLAEPALPLLLQRRARAGKEDVQRLGERLGHPSLPRPEGRLVWLHGASVGESVSLVPLVEAFRRARSDVTVLVTTGTVTSARLLPSRLPAGAFHQFVPIDAPGPIGRFLDHWQPDLVAFCESELWPGWLGAIRARAIPAALINARMSPRSFRRWRRIRPLAATLLRCFDLCLAQSAEDARRLEALLGRPVPVPGNLKDAAAPLPVDPNALDAWRAWTAGRPVWLAASTHPGEEACVLAAHHALAGRHPGLLTVIVPRHPERGTAIAGLARERGLDVARRSLGEPPSGSTQVYVADTLGELGLFYRGAMLALVGGSLVRHGGQNPLEAARLGCPIVIGPHGWNFAAILDRLRAAGAIVEVADESQLEAAVDRLLGDPHERRALAERARGVAQDGAAVVERTLAALLPLLDRHAPRA
jgi:3-deoxy-D-manno-octulosonic-acid transferase